MERRSELYIGTLRKFIEAMNGELVLAARFADGVEVPIKLAGTEDAAQPFPLPCSSTSVLLRCVIDPRDFAGSNRIECPQHGGHKALEIGQAISGSAQNHDGNPAPRKVLLVRGLLIRGDEDLEPGRFRHCEQQAVLQPGQLRVSGGLALVARSSTKIRIRPAPGAVPCTPSTPEPQARG